MSFGEIAKNIESYLEDKKLSFKKTVNADSIIFENIRVGNQTVIAIIQSSINIFVRLTTDKDVKIMNTTCRDIREKYKNIDCIIRKNNKVTLFKIRLPINKSILFSSIFDGIVEKLVKELPPFILGLVTEDVDKFFINQYKLWKSIPPEEQSKMLEDILILKEKYFRSIKTKKGIVTKLNKLKVFMATENKAVEDKQLLKMAFGEDFSESFEFYLIDYAAIFRAVELGLIKLTLTDFFENYDTGRKK